MFISESNKKQRLTKLFVYIGITAFIALFGAVYEQYSHNVHTFYMWFAWIWVLGFGVIPYALMYFLPVKWVPGTLSESLYNLGVAMLTVRSIYMGVIIIYNTTGDNMALLYLVLAISSLFIGALLYTVGLLLNRKTKAE